jgi:hypothetical protein
VLSIKKHKIKKMKKQISFLFTAMSVLVLFSCKKELGTDHAASSKMPESVSRNETSLSRGIQPPVKLDSLLLGRFTFDGNLKEEKGRLADAVPTSATTLTYAIDRKGYTNKAIKLTGLYGLRIHDVVKNHKFSVSAWVKYSNPKSEMGHFVKPEKLNGPSLYHSGTRFAGAISTPTTTSVSSGPLDNDWHHLVATYDGYYLKFYLDGKYVGFSWNIIGPLPTSKDNYLIGFMTWNTYATGFIDDVRLYGRVLNEAEAQAIYQIY